MGVKRKGRLAMGIDVAVLKETTGFEEWKWR